MLYLAAIVLGVILVAGLIGFGGLTAISFGLAKIIFTVVVVLLLLGALFGLSRRQG